MKTLCLILALAVLPVGCAKTPPTLSPPAATAFQNHQIQKVLDLVRDTAQDGHATTPPVFTADTARKITVWHKAAITTLHARGQGWQATVKTGLIEALQTIPEPERAKFEPYVKLLEALLP